MMFTVFENLPSDRRCHGPPSPMGAVLRQQPLYLAERSAMSFIFFTFQISKLLFQMTLLVFIAPMV